MKENRKRDLLVGIGLLCAFVLWTLLIRRIDVQAAGPNGSRIGFASFNTRVHALTGVHMALYTLTDWLGLVPIAICLCFGALGFVQLVKRRRLRLMDPDLLLLGVYFFLVFAVYLFFERVPVNYRPILIEGRLEPSYPSSTTLLVLSVMPTLHFQICRRSAKLSLQKAAGLFGAVFSAFTVIGRFLAGVHWATDIIASILFSAGLFLIYRAAVQFAEKRG